MPIPLRADFDAQRLRAIARGAKDSAQTRRLLALAAIDDGARRTEGSRDRRGDTADRSYPFGVDRPSWDGWDDRGFDVRLKRDEGKCPQTRLWTQTSGDDDIGRGRRP